VNDADRRRPIPRCSAVFERDDCGLDEGVVSILGISTAVCRPVRVAGMAICGTIPGRRAVGMVYVTCGELASEPAMPSDGNESDGGITFKETIPCCAGSSRG
jgi:hypothetical protein